MMEGGDLFRGRVLFVDDEPTVLRGLERMLHRRRAEWDLMFAGTGAEALSMMAAKQTDIIVSDMRMPGLDGPELLAKVRERHPATTRIALSGNAEDSLVRRCVTVAHQYLSKPCSRQEVEDLLERTFTLRELLSDPELEALTASLEKLPSSPAMYREICREFEREEPCTNRVAAIIRSDPAMAAKVLQLANSAFFRRRVLVADVRQAVMHLGLSTIRTLVLGLEVFKPADGQLDLLQAEALWSVSSRVAGLSLFALETLGFPKKVAEEGLSAGLLHLVGRIATLHLEPAVVEDPDTVAHIGAYLLGIWGLPHSIVEAVAFQNDPSASRATQGSVLTGLYIAKHLAGAHRAQPELDEQYFEQIGLVADWERWRRAAQARESQG